MTRRTAIVVVALVVAALVGVALMAVPVVAAAPEADARARPPGRSRDHEAGRAAEGPEADEGGPQPVGLDHARPRRPPRRLRARDPHAGQRPDHDPAARVSRTPRPPRRSSARRPSSSSSTSRRTSRRRRSTRAGSRSRRPRSTTCSRASRRWLRRATPEQYWLFDKNKKLVVGPGRDEGGSAREVRRQAAGRVQAVRGAARHGRRLVRRRRGRLPRRPAVEPDVELLLPLQVRAARRPGDDRLRPEALGHPAGLRHADAGSRS